MYFPFLGKRALYRRVLTCNVSWFISAEMPLQGGGEGQTLKHLQGRGGGDAQLLRLASRQDTLHTPVKIIFVLEKRSDARNFASYNIMIIH